MSARRSLGGILADKAAKCAASKHRRRVGDSRRRKRRRGSDVSSDTSSGSNKRGAFDLAPSRDGNRIQVTSEREPGKSSKSFWRNVEVRTRVAVMSWPLVFCSIDKCVSRCPSTVINQPPKQQGIANQRNASTPCLQVTFVSSSLDHAAPEGGSNGSG